MDYPKIIAVDYQLREPKKHSVRYDIADGTPQTVKPMAPVSLYLPRAFTGEKIPSLVRVTIERLD